MKSDCENSVAIPPKMLYIAGLGDVLQDAVPGLNQHPIRGAVSPIARIHESRNQGVEIGVT